MQFDEHIQRVIRRSKAFYSATTPGHFLVRLFVTPPNQPKIPPLATFDLDRELERWLDLRLEAARAWWNSKSGIDDDEIASFAPNFGIAEHSAWLGAEVLLQESTCLPLPIIREKSDLDRLTLSENTPWFGYMKRGYEHLRTRKDGTFLLSIRGTMMPMDMANAIRGDDLFLDFVDDPPFAHRLMQFLTKAIPWYFQRLTSWADTVEGGQIFQFHNSWMPPGTLGHVSNDAALLCNADVYREFGFPYEAELTRQYTQVLYHVHNQSMHYVPQLAGLPNLSLLEVTRDPKTPNPLENLGDIFACTGRANLCLFGSSDVVRANIEQLKERNVFLRIDCTDRKDAEDILRFVRFHSKPLE